MSATGTRTSSPIKEFVKHHYRHFNAAVVIDASEAYVKHLAAEKCSLLSPAP
jgi:deoxyhypusine synthase